MTVVATAIALSLAVSLSVNMWIVSISLRTSMVLRHVSKLASDKFEFDSCHPGKWGCGMECFCCSDPRHLPVVGVNNSVDCVTHKFC